MTHVIEKATNAPEATPGGVHGIDPRVRIVVMAVFAVVVVALDDFILLGCALMLSALFAVTAHLPLGQTTKRVMAMDLFIVFMLVMLPFTTPGEPMFEIGGLVASWEGLWQALRIALKANAIVLGLLALVGSMEAVTLGQALKRLHVPEKLIHILFFTVRYVEVFGQELHRLRQAMRARAFRPRNNFHSWRSLGYLVGMLLVRSLERSERVVAAMKCRGYTGHLYTLDRMVLRSSDLAFSGVCAGAMAALLWFQHA